MGSARVGGEEGVLRNKHDHNTLYTDSYKSIHCIHFRHIWNYLLKEPDIETGQALIWILASDLETSGLLWSLLGSGSSSVNGVDGNNGTAAKRTRKEKVNPLLLCPALNRKSVGCGNLLSLPTLHTLFTTNHCHMLTLLRLSQAMSSLVPTCPHSGLSYKGALLVGSTFSPYTVRSDLKLCGYSLLVYTILLILCFIFLFPL